MILKTQGILFTLCVVQVWMLSYNLPQLKAVSQTW